MSKLAQAHDINANMVFKWRRELRASQGAMTVPASANLLPVVVQPESSQTSLPTAVLRGCPIEIVIGDATVRVSADTNAALLRMVLQNLRA